MKITEAKNGIYIDIFVKPNSPKFGVQVDGDTIIVQSTEEPEKGKVNKEIVKELTKFFHKKTEIVSGLTSRQKKLFVANLSKGEAEEILSA
ncbi:MAG TPA: DUF167 domain-containing protein [Candidatus Nanoarchaeia archaeon]|nr:DUF167 domain-containing protein [Candidatus Nanoarchaeia archaeon]